MASTSQVGAVGRGPFRVGLQEVHDRSAFGQVRLGWVGVDGVAWLY